MSSAGAVKRAILANRKAIEDAIRNSAAAGQVAAHLMSRPHQISNQMVHAAVNTIAMRVLARDLGQISKKGVELVNSIMAKRGEITELYDMMRKAANDNQRMGREIEEALPKLKTKHHELEALFIQLYDADVAEEFGLAGERPPQLGPTGERPPIRVPLLDAAVKPGTNITRLEGKDIVVARFSDVARVVEGFHLDSAGQATLTTGSGKFGVKQVHLFESANGPVFLFDLDDPQSPGRGMRRAVETRQGGKRRLYLEFEMLEVGYEDKPVLAHIVHAHHLVSDVPMKAFSVFGASKTTGYSYEHWLTILLTNGKFGTPHRTVTTLQAGRLAAMRRWAANAGQLFEAAIAFKKEFGKPNGPKLSDFPGDLSAHSFKTLIDDAADDLRKAGVPEPNVQNCLKDFRKQVNDRIVPLMKDQLVEEHFKAITEGLTP